MGILKNPCLVKGIADVARGMRGQFPQNKAGSAGSKAVVVNPRNTPQNCSRCGTVVPKDLSVRAHQCPYGALSIDPDVNAVLNILGLGLQSSTPKGAQMPATYVAGAVTG
jgi:putative transposase